VNHSVYLLWYLDILLHTARVRTKTRDRGKWLDACMQCGTVVVCHGGQLTGAAAMAHLLLHVVIYIYIVRMCIVLTRVTRAPTIHSAVCVRVYNNNIYAVQCSAAASQLLPPAYVYTGWSIKRMTLIIKKIIDIFVNKFLCTRYLL